MSTTTATKTKNRKIESNDLQFFQGLLCDIAGNYVKLALIKSKNRIYKTCSEYGYFLKNNKKTVINIQQRKARAI